MGQRGIEAVPRQTSYFDGRFGEFLANRPGRRRDKPAIVLKSVDHGESHSRDGMGRYSANSPRQALFVGILGTGFFPLFVFCLRREREEGGAAPCSLIDCSLD